MQVAEYAKELAAKMPGDLKVRPAAAARLARPLTAPTQRSNSSAPQGARLERTPAQQLRPAKEKPELAKFPPGRPLLSLPSRAFHPGTVPCPASAALPLPASPCPPGGGAGQVVYFVNSGTEANEMAMQLARLYTGRYDLITLRNAYVSPSHFTANFPLSLGNPATLVPSFRPA